jgi:hypothetical protein
MLALAVFFGLRGLNPAAPAAPPTAPPGPPALASAPPSPPPVDLAVARQHAANALAYHRGALRQSCYLPAVAGEAPPPTISFTFNFTFDPEGLQIARGVVETRGEARQAITQCVLAQLPPLRIPRPGQVVTADLPLSFP